MEWVCLSSNTETPLILHCQPGLLFSHTCYLSSGWHQRQDLGSHPRQDLANICKILKSIKRVSKAQLFNVPSNTKTEDQEVQQAGGMVKTRIIVLFSQLIEESDGRLCCKETLMLKSNSVIQCTNLLGVSLAEHGGTLSRALKSLV